MPNATSAMFAVGTHKKLREGQDKEAEQVKPQEEEKEEEAEEVEEEE